MAALVSALIFSASQIAINNLLGDLATSLENSVGDYQIEDQYFNFENSRSDSSIGILLKEIKINTLKIPNHSATMNSKRQIFLSFTNVTLDTTFRWEYGISHLSDYGRAYVNIEEGGIKVTLSVSNSTLFKVSTEKVSLDLDKLKIRVEKDSKVNQNWIFQMFQKEIKDLIEDSFSNLIEDAINEFDLGEMYTKVDDVIAFNYSLTQPPEITEKMLGVMSRGIFVEHDNPNYSPPIPKPDIVNQKIEKGVQIVASDYVANSYTYSAYMAGMLDLNITNDTVSEVFPFGLTTTVVGILIPSLIDEYGTDQPMSIFCSFNDNPLVRFHDSQKWSADVSMTGNVGCEVKVNQDVALLIEAGSFAEGEFTLENWKIKGNIETLKIQKVKIISSTIDVDEDDVETIVNDALDNYRKSLNDGVLNDGISLPKSARFDLDNSKIRTGNGNLIVYMEPRLDVDISELFDFVGARRV
jgi:hypothetical protein